MLVHVVVHVRVLVLRVLLLVLVVELLAVVAPLVNVLVVSLVVDRRLSVEVVVVVLRLISLGALAPAFWRARLVVFGETVALLDLLIHLGYSFHRVQLNELETAFVQFFHQGYNGTEDVLVFILFSLLFDTSLQNFLVHLPVCHCLVLAALRVPTTIASRRTFLGNVPLTNFILLGALDMPTFCLQWGHSLRRSSAISVHLLIGRMARTFIPLRKTSFLIAVPGPVIRCLGSHWRLILIELCLILVIVSIHVRSNFLVLIFTVII